MIDRLLILLAKYDAHHDVYWDSNLEFSVLCSDFFYWGCADMEDIETEEDIDLLERCFQDTLSFGGYLYCARKREMRPQGAYYKHLPKNIWHLFDECGPERPTDIGNPKERPAE